MSTTSIVMMIVAMLIVWGGLVVSIVVLSRHDKKVGRGIDPGPGAGPRGEHLTRDL